MPGEPETYGSGIVPQRSDTERMLLVKLILAEGGGGGGGGSVQEIFPGHYGALAPAFTPPAPHAKAPNLDPPFNEWNWNPDTSAWQ